MRRGGQGREARQGGAGYGSRVAPAVPGWTTAVKWIVEAFYCGVSHEPLAKVATIF